MISSWREVEHHPTRIPRRYLRILEWEGCGFLMSFESPHHSAQVSQSSHVQIPSSCAARLSASEAFDVSKKPSQKNHTSLSRVDQRRVNIASRRTEGISRQSLTVKSVHHEALERLNSENHTSSCQESGLRGVVTCSGGFTSCGNLWCEERL